MTKRLAGNAHFPCGKCLSICSLSGVCSLLMFSSVGAYAQNAEASVAVQPRVLFNSTATVTDKLGKSREIRATVSRWIIAPHKSIAEFPEHAFLLVQLRGGRVVTVIDGKEEKRVHGDYWVVPAGAKMSVQCVGEACTLDVVNFSLP